MMHDLPGWFSAGGLVMPALASIGLALFFLITHVHLSTRAELRRVLSERQPSYEELHLIRVSALRRMSVIHACVLVAPLLGLLGTVVGVKTTFDGMLSGTGVTAMSQGIGQALLTTQYGLCIAVPGLVAEGLLRRRIARIETMTRSNWNATNGKEPCAEAS